MGKFERMTVSYDPATENGQIVQRWRERNRQNGIGDSEAVRNLIVEDMARETPEEKGIEKQLIERIAQLEKEVALMRTRGFVAEPMPKDNVDLSEVQAKAVKQNARNLAAKFCG
jgi:hypothetical protein